MPTISRFYGMRIRMYHNDHGVPHFHAIYAARSATFAIDGVVLLKGSLPPPQTRLVRRWAEQHRAELMANWKRARADLPLKGIEPLH